MPSGYTAAIADGISFKEFATNCAKAFGALISLRDEPSDTPVPDKIEPSDYYKKRLEEIRADIVKLNAMSAQDLEDEAMKQYKDSVDYRNKSLAKAKELKRKYEDMLAKAKAYVPPTPDHQGYKDFMVNQIEESIKWDCGTFYYDKPIVKLPGSEWGKARAEILLNELSHAEQQNKEEIRRAEERTNWIVALKKSLE